MKIEIDVGIDLSKSISKEMICCCKFVEGNLIIMAFEYGGENKISGIDREELGFFLTIFFV